ncbi:MAG: hypothetical protein IK015_08420 [Treponema sp.]|nr:hypothetical protein [Treponema sp.]
MQAEKSAGSIQKFDGQTWYKIANVDSIEPFFMTITSSSDAWNFIWSNGALSAGRKDANRAIFPYYTADKILDLKNTSGSFAAVKVKGKDGTFVWEPYADQAEFKVERNLYKNSSGSHVIFEEINKELDLVWRTEWTSSDKYGLVKICSIKNCGASDTTVEVLDGAQNIMPACANTDVQTTTSNLIDAYKKTDLDPSGLALFSMSSVLTDKAEPSEALYANVSYFTKKSQVYLSPKTPDLFRRGADLQIDDVLKGLRASCFIKQQLSLAAGAQEKWLQVFDTRLEVSAVEVLIKELDDRAALEKNVLADVDATRALLEEYVAGADGLQDTGDQIACMHHEANVMFNIMRGGVFAQNNTVNCDDFINFIQTRNRAKSSDAQAMGLPKTIDYCELGDLIRQTRDPQLERLYLEYLPLSFSRRHGDPSRPWNKFSINLKDSLGQAILDYQGNWRDIFQNWEALAMSYPVYITGMIAKFLNATTADGFNPYRITRSGLDWEIPEPNNPWANIGYWNDHQIIYLCKLLELQDKYDPKALGQMLNKKIFTAANIPYHIKMYADIEQNPRDTITFMRELNQKILDDAKKYGSDAKLCSKDGNPYLVTMAAKLLQLILTKLANFVPQGGIWLNTQRPEWNDANNALAGYGLSVVTLCYLRRMMVFVKGIFEKSDDESWTVPMALKTFFDQISELYKNADLNALRDPAAKKDFVKKCGLAFQNERFAFYEKSARLEETLDLSKAEILRALDTFIMAAEDSIKANKRSDGLYHSYNTLAIGAAGMQVGYLEEMLEGQVAVLSSGLLSPKEVADLCAALEKSAMYEERQHSYMLYPSKELAAFVKKNIVPKADAQNIEVLKNELSRGYTVPDGDSLVYNDSLDKNAVHFNPDFRNANVMLEAAGRLYPDLPQDQKDALAALYEKVFDHKKFTGRSGTFYAFEGIGSIYWHMVSKLLLAVQENFFAAVQAKDPAAKELGERYYKIRDGLSFNKTPELYGAFPIDPYSHTPHNQGAKQPGMTGQVKEEVITRWGELGMLIDGGKLRIDPALLLKKEFGQDGKLSFTRFGVPFEYKLSSGGEVKVAVDSNTFGAELSQNLSRDLFERKGKIKRVEVEVPASAIFG